MHPAALRALIERFHPVATEVALNLDLADTEREISLPGWLTRSGVAQGADLLLQMDIEGGNTRPSPPSPRGCWRASESLWSRCTRCTDGGNTRSSRWPACSSRGCYATNSASTFTPTTSRSPEATRG
jgi:hypothetical protein